MSRRNAFFPDPLTDFEEAGLSSRSVFDLIPPPVVESTVFAMNTAVSYKVIGANADLAAKQALAEIVRLENLLTRFRPGSDIHRLNHAQAGSQVVISPETASLVAHGIRLNELTDGNFNLLVGPLVDLWDIKYAVTAPPREKIIACTETILCGQPVLDTDLTCTLVQSGQSVDLGGLAKGYAADRCLDVLRQHDIRSAFFNFGGNVAALGPRPDGSPWQVGIRHPRRSDCLLGAIAAVDCSVVTSGDYERYFIDPSGIRYHHLMNPASGYPARSGLTSVSVISADGMVADALSTAIFIAGREKALQFLSYFPGTEALLVDEDLHVFITPGLVPRFTAQKEFQIEVL